MFGLKSLCGTHLANNTKEVKKKYDATCIQTWKLGLTGSTQKERRHATTSAVLVDSQGKAVDIVRGRGGLTLGLTSLAAVEDMEVEVGGRVVADERRFGAVEGVGALGTRFFLLRVEAVVVEAVVGRLGAAAADNATELGRGLAEPGLVAPATSCMAGQNTGRMEGAKDERKSKGNEKEHKTTAAHMTTATKEKPKQHYLTVP